MIRNRAVVALVVGATLAGGRSAPADDPPAPDGLARLRGFGRPALRPVGAARHAGGTVTAVDDRSITIRGQFGVGIDNAKEEDTSGSDRFGRWLRQDPTKPIVLLYPGWEVDCHAVRYTPEGMTVTVLSGNEVVVKNADLPTRRFPATAVLRDGRPDQLIPAQKHCHLLREVRVGDEAQLYLTGPPGKEECLAVTIRRRPGGRVPHSTVNPEFFREMIDWENAYQGHEERGTPIPDRFRRDLRRLRDNALLMDLDVPATPPPKRP